MSSSFPILSMTIQDLLPSGWSRASSKKVDMDAVLPFMIVPLLLSTATVSLSVTIIVMVVIGMGVLYVCSRPRQKNRSPFFFSWTISSGLCMFLVFEGLLLKLYEVTQLEHFIFLLLLACTSYFFYKMKTATDSELTLGSYTPYSPVLTADSYYCQICQIEVNERFFHSIWWDCCIVRPNYAYFLAGQVFSFFTLLHGTNLGLTTVCEPFMFYGNVLLPEDCSVVYFDFQFAVIFVTCIYGLGYLCVIVLVLIQQVIVYIPKYIKCNNALKI